jgi:radical SAM protein with 4Fe4S-binding SPASM domain
MADASKNAAARRSAFPRAACLDTTYRCNLRCVHCNVSCLRSDARSELELREFEDLFLQLDDLGVRTVTLTGGEFLLREDWEEIARSACARFRVGLFTNAVSVTERIALRLAALPPALIEVSVYGASERVYEEVTGVAGSFRRFQAGLERLHGAGLRVVPKAILLRHNAHEWPEILRRYGDQPDFKWSAKISPRFDGDRAPLAHAVTDAQLLKVLRTERPRRRKPRGGNDSAVCGSARTGLAVSAHGDVFPCGMMPVSGGNIREKGLREVWEGPLFQEVRRLRRGDLAGCAACAALPYCKPCPGMNRLESGDMRNPAPSLCREARFRQMAAELRLK